MKHYQPSKAEEFKDWTGGRAQKTASNDIVRKVRRQPEEQSFPFVYAVAFTAVLGFAIAAAIAGTL